MGHVTKVKNVFFCIEEFYFLEWVNVRIINILFTLLMKLTTHEAYNTQSHNDAFMTISSPIINGIEILFFRILI